MEEDIEERTELEQKTIDKAKAFKCPAIAGHEFLEMKEGEDVTITLNRYANESEKQLFDFLIVRPILSFLYNYFRLVVVVWVPRNKRCISLVK